MNEVTMMQVYRDAQKACGLSEGDRVKVTRAAESREGGWPMCWNPAMMDKCVGATGRIRSISYVGVEIDFGPAVGKWIFPYFVLEKADGAGYDFKPFDRVLVRDDDSDAWEPAIFIGYFATDSAPYRCIGAEWHQCIPYEGNESLAWTKRAAGMD